MTTQILDIFYNDIAAENIPNRGLFYAGVGAVMAIIEIHQERGEALDKIMAMIRKDYNLFFDEVDLH